MKAYVFDPLWDSLVRPPHLDQLKQAGVELVLTSKIVPLADQAFLRSDESPKILAVNPDYVGWSLPAAQFLDIPNLRCIITGSTSYGWIDIDAAKERNIPVCNSRNFSTEAVADWAIMMMLNVARKIPLLIKNNFPLNFDSDFETYRGINLKGKTVGIIGMGHIGQAIAERCEGLGLSVLYWNRTDKPFKGNKADLSTLFQQSDVLFPCLADTDDTKKIITTDLLSSMKKTALFISIAHKLYDHDFVVQMAKNGSLYGYGFEGEPSTFSQYEGNVWAAPSYGWCTDGSMQKLMDCFVEAIANAAQGRYPTQV